MRNEIKVCCDQEWNHAMKLTVFGNTKIYSIIKRTSSSIYLVIKLRIQKYYFTFNFLFIVLQV